MRDGDLETIIVDAAHMPDSVGWADRLAVSLTPSLIRTLAARDTLTGSAFQEEARAVADNLKRRAAFTPTPPTSSRLPAHYHRIPAPVRHAIAHGIGRLQRSRQAHWAHFPGWPLDLSADFAADLAQERRPAFAPTPVLLSHDIDTPEGLRNLVAMFLPVEEAVGARSSNYIVPCAWPVDDALAKEILARGHEIGVHGFNHANRTPFCSAKERRERIDAGRTFGDRYGATGYRAPSLLRTEALLVDLAGHYRYDSSLPTAGGAFPVPNNGCATARPWRLGKIWEIPLTLPRDGSLRFLGHSPSAIAALWRETTETIVRSGGIVSLLTHCEAGFSGNEAMLGAYRRFIAWMANDSRFVFMRMDALAAQLEAEDATRNG